nr:CBN-UGT-64 protein [Haemonchus contortus]
MPQGRSHTGSFMALINKLKNDGHQVFLYMEAYPDEMNFGLEDRILRIKNHTNPFADDKFQTFLWQDDYGVTDQRLPFFYGAGSCETVLKEHRDHFNQMVEEKFDLILTDTLFAACAYGIATLNQAHHVLMSSTHIESATGSMRAYGINFVLTPRHYMPVDDTEFKPSYFRYRLASTLEWIENFVINGIIVGERMKIALAPVVSSFCFFEYHKTASATLTDMPTDLIGPFPRTNDVSGTVINWGQIPKSQFEAVLRTLSSLTDYRIVWAYNGKEMKMKSHIYALKWIPQGYGEVFSKHNLTTENLTAVMKRVLENKRFTSNAARMTMLFNDKVIHPLKHGVHYVNRLLKYGGRMPEFFYPCAITRDYLSYLNLDIFIIPLIIVIGISY